MRDFKDTANPYSPNRSVSRSSGSIISLPKLLQILFAVDLISVDTDAGQLTLDWYFSKDDKCSGEGYNETMCSTFVDVFIDT